MKKNSAIIVAIGVLGLCQSGHGLTTEWIGPSRQHPAVARQDWPAGIVEIPKHMSRVYSLHGGFGNESFYFECKVDQINELLTVFAKARIRDHVVRIERGTGRVRPFFDKEKIEYNVRLEIVSGIALALARDSSSEALPLEPRLTIMTGNDNSIIEQLKWPENLTVESKIRGVSVNKDRKKPKREAYYGLCEFANSYPHAEPVKGVNSPITLWEPGEPNGIGLGRTDNKGYFTILLSRKELADLREGTTWLTITIGGWLVKAKKTDMRFPVEMLTRERDKAGLVEISHPAMLWKE